MKLDRKGRRLLANCSDRVIRWAHVASPAAQEEPGSFSAEEVAARVRTPAKVFQSQAQCMQQCTTVDNGLRERIS